MIRSLATALTTMLFALPLCAETDLSLKLALNGKPYPGDRIHATAMVTNPGVAAGDVHLVRTLPDLAVDMPAEAFTVGATLHATNDSNAANDSDSITISPIEVPHPALAIDAATPLRTAQPNMVTVTLSNDGADATTITQTLIPASGSITQLGGQATATGSLYRPEDAHATLRATIGATAALRIDGTGDDEIASDGTIGFRFTVAHAPQSTGTATKVSVTIETFARDLRFASASGADCHPTSSDQTQVACTLADIPQGTIATFEVRYHATAPAEYTVFPTIRWDNLGLENFGVVSTIVYRPVDVTTVDDFVPGSLRAAIDEVNRGGCPCRIAFRIPAPVPASGWFTLRPIAPLPAIMQPSHVLVDGFRQTALTGDTNPRGPEIEINGSRTTDDGLVLGYLAEVRGSRSTASRGTPSSSCRPAFSRASTTTTSAPIRPARLRCRICAAS